MVRQLILFALLVFTVKTAFSRSPAVEDLELMNIEAQKRQASYEQQRNARNTQYSNLIGKQEISQMENSGFTFILLSFLFIFLPLAVWKIMSVQKMSQNLKNYISENETDLIPMRNKDTPSPVPDKDYPKAS